MDMQFEIIYKTHPLWPQIIEFFPEAIKWLKEPDKDSEYIFWASFKNNILTGGAIIDIRKMGFGPLSDMLIGFLEDIKVDIKFRRKGIGIHLLSKVLEYAWKAECHNVRWTVDYVNTPAIAMYRKAGAIFIPDEDPDADNPIKQYTVVAGNPYQQKQVSSVHNILPEN